MLIRKAFRFRLKVNEARHRLLSQYAGCNRLVWNKALALQEGRKSAGEKRLNYHQLSALLPSWKKELPFLDSAPAQTYQQTLMHLERAFRSGFAKVSGFPRYKKKGRKDSFRIVQGFQIEEKRVFLPKLGWMPFFASQKVTGKPKNITVSRHLGRWYVSIQVEFEVTVPIHQSPASAVGIDMGIANFATLSTGERITPLDAFRTAENKLAYAQQKLARKARFSRNWHKQRKRVERIHDRIACSRKDFLHKVSNRLSKNHALLVLEDLNVRNMSASAKGTAECPGKCVRVKAGLNKAILDQGWFRFRTFLEYKARWRGGHVLAVAPRHTSQRCSACGFVSSANRLKQASFSCLVCCFTEHADVNAAKNILAAGHAVTACGGSLLGANEAGTHQEVA